MRAAVVIPVFNEGERVLAVANASYQCLAVKEVIIVDDGSTDQTAEFLTDQEHLTVVKHAYNCGKGEALDTGMDIVLAGGYDAAVFLDGDLKGIQASHIDQLLAPIKTEESYMSIGYLGLRKAVNKLVLNRWGALSGQRAILPEVWELLNAQDKHGWNVEAALNARLRKADLHHTIARIALDGVSHVGKQHKESNWPKALWAYTKTYSAALKTYARIELGA